MAIRLSPAQQRALMQRHAQRLRNCEPWSSAVKWKPELSFQGLTYKVRSLWPDVRPSDAPVDELGEDEYVDSPSKRFRYCVRLHRRGHALHTWWGNQVGTVIFDTDVIIPALYQCRPDDERRDGYWRPQPWMSLTPAELMTLRPGTRLSKGRTLVAGLGLGHQLIEVSKRIQVKRVILVELDQELVDWILPVVRPHMRKPLQVVVGDAYEVIPTLEADVALIDIFPGYGDGFQRVRELAAMSPKIKKFWGWGESEMTGLAQR